MIGRLLPVRFYRCHECQKRGPRMVFKPRPILESLGLLILAFLLVYTLLVLLRVVR